MTRALFAQPEPLRRELERALPERPFALRISTGGGQALPPTPSHYVRPY